MTVSGTESSHSQLVEDDAVPAGGDLRLVRNASWRLGGDAAAQLLNLAFVLFVARRLGVSGFGVLMTGLVLTEVCGKLGEGGLQTLVSRDVAQQSDRWSSYLRDSLGLRLATAAPLVAGSVALAWVLDYDPATLQIVALLAPVAQCDKAISRRSWTLGHGAAGANQNVGLDDL